MPLVLRTFTAVSRGKFGLVSVIQPISNFLFSDSEATCSPSLANFQRLIFQVSIRQLLPHCTDSPGILTATRISARLNLPSLDLSPDRPSPRPPKYRILLYQKAQIFVRLAIETKGYSQVMPLIVENSRTMSSPESRSVKRPSESASCIRLFCRFLSVLKIWRMLCCVCSPPHERSRNQDQPPYL
jgi:hypothetical protein